MKLWGGRFDKDTAEEVNEFTQSLEADERMVLEDIWGSEAHALMLASCDIISNDDLGYILTWLEKAKEDYSTGKFKLKKELEDVHLNVENYVIERAGMEYGGKLHTARSRNDQVLTASKLYLRPQVLGTEELIIELQIALLKLAEKHRGTILPGYTHTQHAQPISFAFWATGYVSMFFRDLDRLSNAYKHINSNPLGASALSGTSFAIDRELTAKLLGFDSVHEHALDVISSRDFIAETLSALAILMSNLSRIATEIVYWSTYEFRMIKLDDAFATGSSIMPQKKNPEVAELIRGRTGRVYGALVQVLTALKGIPTAYNSDLQEDKPPLFNSLELVQSALFILRGMIETMEVNRERMEELASANFSTATELANSLVREHRLSFRECHRIVGNIVGELVRNGDNFLNISKVKRMLEEADIDIGEDKLEELLDPREAIERQRSLGSTSPAEVDRMIGLFVKEIERRKEDIANRRGRIEEAYRLTTNMVSKYLGDKI